MTRPRKSRSIKIQNMLNAKKAATKKTNLSADADAIQSCADPTQSYASASTSADSNDPPPIYTSTLQKRTELINQCTKFGDTKFLDTDNNNVTISKKVLTNLVSSSFCNNCMSAGKITFEDVDSDVSIEIKCPICETLLFSQAPDKVPNKNFVADTASLVVHSMNTGYGFAGYTSLTANLNLRAVNSRRYEQYKHFIGIEMQKKNELSMEGVRECIELYYALELGIEPDKEGILDIEVSFDGTWQKRGHTSHYGAAAVIECHTGFIVDYEVLSNFCHWCSKSRSKKRTAEQKQEHKKVCNINFDGKSGAMEKESAIKIWKRSEQVHKLRYTTFVSDGDSSAYKGVIGMNNGTGPYTKKVIKEECVNHVAKRLGTRLRALKKTTAVEKVTKTGKKLKSSALGGKDKLTDFVITKLTEYFGNAIRSNVGKTTDSMRRSIMASYFHYSSTDKDPVHKKCPTGENTWCFYNKAKAMNVVPKSHNSMKVKFHLDEADRMLVRDVYLDLTTEELLGKCLKGRTQNANESFHAKLWSRVSKAKFTSLQTLTYVIAGAVSSHNIGYLKGSFTRSDLGFISTEATKNKLQGSDKERLRKSLTPKGQKRKRAQIEDVDYQSGAF